MSFLSLTCSTSGGGYPAKRESLRTLPRVTAITLTLVGMVVFWATSTGLAKDRTPTSRTVSGVVMDESENAIKGATVELTDLQTKKVLDIYSQEGGEYQYSDLRFDHDYTVQATFNGLSSEVRQVSSIDTRWHMVLNLTLLKQIK